MSKFYLAGPMTGIPYDNLPLFEHAAADLRANGLDIISPAELDSPAARDAVMADPTGKTTFNDAAGTTWGNALARDVELITDSVDGIIFLDGWQASRGARLEAFVGILCDHEFYLYSGGSVHEISATEVLLEIVDVTA